MSWRVLTVFWPSVLASSTEPDLLWCHRSSSIKSSLKNLRPNVFLALSLSLQVKYLRTSTLQAKRITVFPLYPFWLLIKPNFHCQAAYLWSLNSWIIKMSKHRQAMRHNPVVEWTRGVCPNCVGVGQYTIHPGKEWDTKCWQNNWRHLSRLYSSCFEDQKMGVNLWRLSWRAKCVSIVSVSVYLWRDRRAKLFLQVCQQEHVMATPLYCLFEVEH